MSHLCRPYAIMRQPDTTVSLRVKDLGIQLKGGGAAVPGKEYCYPIPWAVEFGPTPLEKIATQVYFCVGFVTIFHKSTEGIYYECFKSSICCLMSVVYDSVRTSF